MSTTNETQIKIVDCNSQLSKYTTLRVFKKRRNKIRSLAEKKGLRIESLTDHLLLLGIEQFNSGTAQQCS